MRILAGYRDDAKPYYIIYISVYLLVYNTVTGIYRVRGGRKQKRKNKKKEEEEEEKKKKMTYVTTKT